MPITRYEMETIINFNAEEDMASIFTHSPTWQRHLEKRLGLKPVRTVNDGKGREYILPRACISLPRLRTKRPLSPERKAEMQARFARGRSRAQGSPRRATA